MDKHTKGQTRRDFMKTSAIAAGLGVAGKLYAQEQAAPAQISSADSADDLNVAVIGLGIMGDLFIDRLIRLKGVRIKTVCDIWEYKRKRMANRLKKYGYPVTIYEDYREMLEKEKDLHAVFIMTPDFVHAEQAIACLQAGLHVYCEAPMSHDAAQARRMVQTARETEKLLQIGHERRSNPRYIHAIQTLIRDRHVLGRVTHGNAHWNREETTLYGWPQKYEMPAGTLEKYGYRSMQEFRNWKWFRKYSGGPLVIYGAQQLDVFNWALGCTPSNVTAFGDRLIDQKWESLDNATCIFEYKTEAGVTRVSYEILSTNDVDKRAERFIGFDGALTISDIPGLGDTLQRVSGAQGWRTFLEERLLGEPYTVFLDKLDKKKSQVEVRDSERPQVYIWPIPVQCESNLYELHISNFLSAVREGTPLSCPPEVGFAALAAALKIEKAIKKGRRMACSPAEFIV